MSSMHAIGDDGGTVKDSEPEAKKHADNRYKRDKYIQKGNRASGGECSLNICIRSLRCVFFGMTSIVAAVVIGVNNCNADVVQILQIETDWLFGADSVSIDDRLS